MLLCCPWAAAELSPAKRLHLRQLIWCTAAAAAAVCISCMQTRLTAATRTIYAARYSSPLTLLTAGRWHSHAHNIVRTACLCAEGPYFKHDLLSAALCWMDCFLCMPEWRALQEIDVPDAADAAAHKVASDAIRSYRVARLTPVLIVCEWSGLTWQTVAPGRAGDCCSWHTVNCSQGCWQVSWMVCRGLQDMFRLCRVSQL